MPKVSVIVPVYGVEKYIERCARSLFEQTLDDIEYLFIDDCTPDHSIEMLLKIMEEYPQRKPQVIIHRMEMNSGQAKVREWGIKNATGEYLIHCDGDDWVEITMYEKLYNKAISEGDDIVMCNYYTDNGNGDKHYKNCIVKSCSQQELFRAALLQDITSAVWNKLVRRELVPQEKLIYAKYNMGEDYLLVIQYFFFAKKIAIIDEPLYHYYLNNNSITNFSSVDMVLYRFHQSIRNMEGVEKFLSRENIDLLYQKEIDKLKYNKRNYLLPLLSSRNYYNLWRRTFSEINFRILANPYLSLREKLRYIMAYLRIISLYHI